MAEEIERKFLLQDDRWRAAATASSRFSQGYLVSSPQLVVRVRLEDNGAQLTVKGATDGIGRLEYEYPVPPADAREMLGRLCQRPLIEKRRFFVPYGDHLWEIDEFEGDNAGLVVAEIELKAEDEAFQRPPWLGREVTGDARYYNACLGKRPYRDWSEDPERADDR